MSTATPMSLMNIFVEPKSVFDNLKENKKWSWLGLLLIIAVAAVSSLMFFGGMSSEWLVEQQLMAAGEMSASDREATRQGLEMMADYTGILATVSIVVMLPLMTLLFAAYNNIIGSTVADSNPEFKFGDWYSFTIWSQMPAIINSLGFMALFLTAATVDLPISMPNYASLNQLFLDYVPGDSLYNWAESLNIFSLWSVVITAIGFNRCCKMSMTKAFIYALLPFVAIFGIWFVIA